METIKIRVLHIVKDDKFIDGPLSYFEDDGRFANQAVMIVDSPDYQFRLIKNTNKIKLLYNKQMVKDQLQKDDYDVIFFYSLTNYRIFEYIPHNKIVIWWAWGYDIYGSDRFIDIPLFKPHTQKYLNKKNVSLAFTVKQLFKRNSLLRFYKYGSKKKAIRRVDYFQPVIHVEYLLMKKHKGFRAHEFYYPGGWNFSYLMEGVIPKHEKSIIIGHCASDTGNHIDVWEATRRFIPSGTNIYIPISYGDSAYASYLVENISSKDVKVLFMKDFLPKDEYFNVLDSCGYAIFGVLREQAIGNIFRCLFKGIKVFLYKESIPYQYLKELGCDIYSIDDINESSFIVPMTITQIRHNQQCLIKESERVQETREQSIKEIMIRLNNKGIS